MKKTIIRNMDRDIIGRFACTGTNLKRKRPTFMSKVKHAATVLALYTGLTAVALMFFFAGGYFNPVTVIKAQQVEVDNLSGKIEDLQNEVVASIGVCESAGKTDGIITFDPHRTNKSVEAASIGRFQYKVPTVQYYYKLLYNKKITRKEAILIALDDTKAEQLTHDVLFRTKNGQDNWINCSKKLTTKLNVIDSLTN